MAPTLYMTDVSPPSRTVLIIAKSIELDLELKNVDCTKKEQNSAEFRKLNPQRTIPLLIDNDGFKIWDSHAIIPYILTTYAQNDSLYPKDPKKRAVIDQRMHFDSGVAWPEVLRIFKPIIYEGKKSVDQEQLDKVVEVYDFVESFLKGNEWIAGDSLSIADYCFVTTITSLDIFVQVNPGKYPNLAVWLKKVTALPEYEVSKKGHQDLVNLFASLMK